MSSGSLQYAGSPEEGDASSTDKGKNLFHESDVDRASEDFENESSDSESDNSDLAELPSSHNVFGTSVPSAGFFTPSSAQTHNASYTMNSLRSAISSFGTRQSFSTARSSPASYVTASGNPRRRWVGLTQPTDKVNVGQSVFVLAAEQELIHLANAIERRLLQRTDTTSPFGRPRQDLDSLRRSIFRTLTSCLLQRSSVITSLEPTIEGVVGSIKTFACFSSDVHADAKLDVAVEVYKFALDVDHLKNLVPSGIFVDGDTSTSEWLMHLYSCGILADEAQALDWSGRGQHAEYSPVEESLIPLVEGKVLGYSMSAVVQRVRCRRIQLARKTIQCNRKFTKEMAITEVEHLQRAQHRHVVRVVGTYTLRKKLAILLYPAAKWNLDEFLDEVSDQCLYSLESETLRTFFRMLGQWHTLHTQLLHQTHGYQTKEYPCPRSQRLLPSLHC